ncbi:LysR family transcriptional regulator [Clavibacter michiganensis subsp. michiganensis]|uniref:LysR family transcriptional regulator n=1 Tax=Clavibacter michiganensis TaxID=28447 RepID=UPI000B64773F|nr:LysR substrate-binding domain-containing protein [Clavibacter michiganensis]MBE3077274.1 LysR family transcriptional regulator [Clavibacter michiganensis subsp. michiganensis]MWJ19847.1 LysR family transcriptional regulator [Clavibacter michiganensis subsp. michiganensis]OUD96753.1 Hca operon transcriptional activator [Clavibacter michiganensis subsp. michiganensis]OUE06585.1 Hca operon transcriptional activator [Clavibacter michiganensis subsp. michiganensis]
MDLDLRLVRSFLAVADERHFGRAAEQLGIAQPVLSQQVQRLERRLGVTLLVRTSRSVAVTPAGAALRERGRALLRQAEAGLDEVARIARGDAGRLEIGMVHSTVAIPAERTGPVESIRRFRAHHPDVEVRVREGFTADLMESLERGELDVAIVRDPDPTDGVDLVELLTEPFAAVVPVAHPLAALPAVDAALLADEPFVFPPRRASDDAYRRNLEPVTERGRLVRVVQEGSTWTMIIHLVGAGLGVTIAPRSATVGAPDTVRVLPLLDAHATSTVHVATRAADPNPVVRAFLEARLPGVRPAPGPA